MWGRKKAKDAVDESLDTVDFDGVEVEVTNIDGGEIAVESIIASHIDFKSPYVVRCDCSTCKTQYSIQISNSNMDNVPKLLPCLHTFCAKCIMNKMIRHNKNARNSLIICSICQAEALIETNGIPNIALISQLLPDDVAVIHAIELFADIKTNSLIDEYKKHEYTCSKCNKFGNIPKAYSPSSKDKSLKIKSSPIATNDLNYDDMTKCLDCNSIICLKCAIFGTCRGHNMKQINELALETRQDLQFILKDVHTNIENLIDSMDTINELMQNTVYRTANVKSNIKDFFDKLRSALDSQELKFINAIDGYCDVNMQEFGKEKLVFTEQILITSSAYKWAKFIHKNSSDVQYIRLHELMKQRLVGLNKIQMKVKGVTPSFTFSSDADAVRNFTKYITDIGETRPTDGSSQHLLESQLEDDSEDDLDIFKTASSFEYIQNASQAKAKPSNSTVPKVSSKNNNGILYNSVLVMCTTLMLAGIQAAYILRDRKIIELDYKYCTIFFPAVTYVGIFHILIVAIAKTLQK